MGHTSFVTCSAAVPTAVQQAGGDTAAAAEEGRVLILTGSGDGTVRLWDAANGKCLAKYVAAEQQQQQEQDDGEQEEQQQEEAQAGEAMEVDGAEAEQPGRTKGQKMGEEGQESEAAAAAGGGEKGEQGGDEQGEGEGQKDEDEEEEAGGEQKKRWPRNEREQCSAVLSVAVSPNR